MNSSCNNLFCVLGKIAGYMNSVVLIIIGLSVVVFLWGLIKYLKSIDDKTRKEAVGTITYGLIALFVMTAVWGLVNIFTGTFEFTGSDNSIRTQSINPLNLIKR